MYIAKPAMLSGRRGRRPLHRLQQICFRAYAIRPYKSLFSLRVKLQFIQIFLFLKLFFLVGLLPHT